MEPQSIRKILVLGAGSWGATLAHLLAGKGYSVVLWTPLGEEAEQVSRERTLPGKIEGFHLAESVQVGSDLPALIEGGIQLAMFAVPGRHLRESARHLRTVSQSLNLPSYIPVFGTKGLENGTLKTPSQVLSEELGISDPVALSGPSHAEEVCIGLPTTVVAASRDHHSCLLVQKVFMTPAFRVYTSQDITGVELGGAMKNVLAIAAGAAAGLGLGDNTMAALVTRGLAEMTRLGVAMGASPLTFAGLSGLGDLVVTCASRHSRNRRLGFAMARGASVDEALKQVGMVVEGVETARSVEPLKDRYHVELPIATQVALTLFGGVPVREAVQALMMRDPKPEWEGGESVYFT